MITPRSHTWLAAILLMAASLASAGAQSTLKLVSTTESKLWVEGGSNLHDWKCSASVVSTAIDADAAIARTDASAIGKLVQKLTVRIPATSLKCGEDRMDKNVYKALDTDKFPEISYILTSLEPVSGAGKDTLAAKAVGKLTIAGVEKTITMDVQAVRTTAGALRATASVPMLMTDFGIKPPTALLGTLRTKDRITVKFDLLVDRAGAVATPPVR